MEDKMNKNYDPDSRFVERLEWQLSSEYRRRSRLKSPAGKIAVSRRVATIAVVAGVLTTGVAVTKAADYIKDSWRKKIEIARVETDVELKRVHLESIREMAADVEVRVSEGLIREEEFQAMQLAVANAELDFKRSLMNLDEVKLSGDIPRNELHAPLVGGRDFVSERLEMERTAVELSLEQLRYHLGRYHRLTEQNLVRGHEMDQIQAEIANRKTMIDEIQQRLDLRAQFLTGELTAQAVEIEDRLTGAEKSLHIAQTRVEFMKVQLNRLEALEARGEITHMEVMQMQYALDAAQAELKLAILEMDVLEKLR
jgi:multidrug resistance efflux pump